MTAPRNVPPLPTENWDPALAHVSADMNGAPINVHKLMAHSPGLLAAWWDFRNFSVNGGSLGQRLGELTILRVSVHLGSWYEWGHHVDRSVRLGMPINTVQAVLQWEIGADWDPLDAAVLRAVDELVTRRGITEATRSLLEADLSTAQIMDLIAIHGMYMTLGCMIGTWGLELDAPVVERIGHLVDRDGFETAARRFREAAGHASQS